MMPTHPQSDTLGLIMASSELFTRGTQELKAGHYDDAQRLFRENEAKEGTTARTLGQLNQAERKLAAGDLAAAAKLFAEAQERNPGLPEAYLGLARIALAQGQVDAAEVQAKAVTRLSPQLGLGWTLLGLVAESRGEVDTALEHLKKGALLSRGVFLCQLNLGRVLASAGRPEDGVAALNAAVALDPSNSDGHFILGLAHHKAKQHHLALRSLERAKELSPKDLDKWATLADVLFEVREFQAARDLLDHGLVACGEHPALLEKAVATAMMLSDAQGAIDYLNRELVLVPNHEQGWLNLASLYLTTKDFDKAEAAAKTLLEKNPANWEAWSLLGTLYSVVPAEAQAEAAYLKAVEHSKGNFKPLMNLGTLYVESSSAEKHAEAVKVLQQAKALAPKGEWRVDYNLALAFTRLGQTKRALELARTIQREADPSDEMVAQAKRLESNLLERLTPLPS